MPSGPPSQTEFRAAARRWLEENVPRDPRPADGPGLRRFDCDWQRRQHDGGWAGIDWDPADGGRGLAPMEQIIWYEELARAGAPSPGFSCLLVALNNVGPTLVLHGSARQRAQHLPAILRGDEVWCQAFSEPGAGSDLASLTTRGEVDGDELIVRGQKIWTSFAQYSDYAEALVRTEPGSERHRGLSLVIIHMSAPGVEVRPIEQIDGRSEFCEVFLDDVRVPLDNVVGELGSGWEVALSTLALERGPAVLDLRLASVVWTDRLVAELRRRGLEADEGLRERLGFARAAAAANRSLAYYHVAAAGPEGRPGPETTAVRTFHVELEQEVARLGIDLVGDHALMCSEWTTNWLHQFMSTIAGGTVDIQRNIIGERVLGLPR